MRFAGTVQAKVDAKGRVFVPSAFRRQLAAADAELVLRKDVYQPCLVIYPRSVWDNEVDQLSLRLNRWNPAEAMLFRQFLASAETLTVDAAGRILLTKQRLAEAAIDHDLVFVGVDDRVEIWSAERAAAVTQPSADFAAGLETAMGSCPAQIDNRLAQAEE